MTILRKLTGRLRSRVHRLISRADGAERMLQRMVRDLEKEIAHARYEVAAAIADERRLRAELEAELRQLGVRLDEAAEALRSRGDRSDDERGSRARLLEEAWARRAAEAARMKASLRQLDDKIEEARRKRDLLSGATLPRSDSNANGEP